MKKAFLLLSLVAGTFAASAHGNQHEDFTFFKPSKGDVTTEAGLVGGILNSDLKLNNNAGMLRGRYFVKNNLAIRAGLNLSIDNEKLNFNGPNGATGTISTTATTFAINAGIEKHFRGTARLSPYVGGDIIYGLTSNTINEDNARGGSYEANYTNKTTNTDVSLGIRGVVGADYYIAPKLYLGGEVGLGLNQTWLANEKGSNFNFGPSIVTGVRIGFVF
jgi:outer membrane protein W